MCGLRIATLSRRNNMKQNKTDRRIKKVIWGLKTVRFPDEIKKLQERYIRLMRSRI
jgi:hypothetical protein